MTGMRGNGLRSRRIAAIAVATVLVSMVTACGSDDDGGGGIVVTTNVLGDVVTDLVQGEADVTVLMQPDANPHSFGVSAREAAARSSGVRRARAARPASAARALASSVVPPNARSREHGPHRPASACAPHVPGQPGVTHGERRAARQ